MKITLLKEFPSPKELNTFLMTSKVTYVDSYVFNDNLVLVFSTLYPQNYS